MRHRPTVHELFLWAALLASGGCGETASESVRPPITRASLNAAARHTVTGLGSCASSGCHGQTLDGQQRNWKLAYSVWLSEDPHRRAFHVLYTERSVEMFGNLHGIARNDDRLPSDAEYLQFLEARCIGCHATEQPGSSNSIRYGSGIHCESCHGSATDWLHEHYMTTWHKPGSQQRASLAATGFRDTADLRTRAAVCVGCHVGPQVVGHRLYDVDHDLIAAGHPRLAFEFDAYLQNYPKHWDEVADEQRHRSLTGGSFHVDAWRFGQEQTARQLVEQIRLRISHSRVATCDFSSYECFDCHHALGSASHGNSASRGGLPRPALAPLANLDLMRPDADKLQTVRDVLANGRKPSSASAAEWQSPLSTVLRKIDDTPLSVTSAAALPDHAGLLVSLIPRDQDQVTFDQAVQFYLAVQALSRDMPDGVTKQALTTAASELLAALSDPANFAVLDGRVTQYDSPATFHADNVTPRLEKVRTVLQNIENRSRITPAP